MRKRRTWVLIWSAAVAICLVAGLTALGELLPAIFAYTADGLCVDEMDAPEPRQETIYVACGSVPAAAPALNDATLSSSG